MNKEASNIYVNTFIEKVPTVTIHIKLFYFEIMGLQSKHKSRFHYKTLDEIIQFSKVLVFYNFN